MIYYIADIHFKDQVIFEKCKRPFKSLDEMEEAIISNWNNRVTDDDVVYILGDLGINEEAIEVYRKLKGQKHLIVGNHDIPLMEYIAKSNIFLSFKAMDFITDGDKKVFLCHYPLMDWWNYNYGSYLVYGHIHNKDIANGLEYEKIKEYYEDKFAFNCGVDVIGFTPRTLEELVEIKEGK